MTVVRIEVDLDPDHRQAVLDVLRDQPDVVAVTAGAASFDLELAGYQLDAARGRASEALRTAATAVGADLGAFEIASAPDVHPGGFGP